MNQNILYIDTRADGKTRAEKLQTRLRPRSCCRAVRDCARRDLRVHKTYKPRLLDSQRLFTKSHGSSMERKVLKMSRRAADRGIGQTSQTAECGPLRAACHIGVIDILILTPADICSLMDD